MCENMIYLCRLCLKHSEFRFSLFTGNILHKIESLASVKIDRDDKLPQTCCEACVANVYTSYKFQQCMIESDKTLREKLIHSESQIIEHAKQAPDLFEILHIDGPSNTSNKEVLVEPKIENNFNQDCGYGKYECKSEQISSYGDNGATPVLFSKNDMEYDFVDKLKFESSNVDNIYNDLENLKSDGEEKSTLTDLVNPDDGGDINKIYKKLGIKEKYSTKLEVYREKQKANEDGRLAILSSGEVLTELGIQNKFDQKFAAYREKLKVNQTALECTDCDKKFETKRLLQRHMIKHKIDRCPFCFITMRSDNLKRHIQIHSDSPEVCEICGKIAKNKESLRGHVNYQHKNTEMVKCEPCNREFKSNHHYKAHVKKIHLGIRNHQCHICGKKFFANHDLNKHINMTHRGARPYICQYCKKGFSSPYARKTHIRQHTLETPYRCEVCAAGFRQKVSLVTHLKSKHSIITKKNDNNSKL